MDEKVLGQEKSGAMGYAGDFVLKNQKTSDAQGFRNVSKAWYDKCQSYDSVMDQVAEDQNKIQDIRAPLSDFTPVVSDTTNEAVLRYKDGREVSFKRDAGDAELLVHCLQETLWRKDRFDQDVERLWRTWNDGTLRAMLSNKYAIVNNQWMMDIVREAIPGGMLSHWRGDADNIFGNVLIPDSIREEDDSDYGGMLSIGNSEIGMRRISSCPSVFRAICMNGCIWDQEKGKEIRQVHRGELDLLFLGQQIKANLTNQIPLMNRGIDLLLKLREFRNDGVSMARIVGQVCKDNKITKKHSYGVLKSFLVEKDEVDSLANSAFGVVNAITRFGQTLGDSEWVKFDEIGGKVANITEPKWNATVRSAKSLDEKDLEKLFGSVAA